MLADEVEEWCKGLYANKRDNKAVLLTGPFGCGKTRFLDAAHQYVQDIKIHAWPRYWSHPIIVSKINWAEFVRSQSDDKNRRQMDELVESDVVFIDDLGAEEDRFNSGEGVRILGDTLGKLEKKFLFITSNISPVNRGWKQRWDERVEDRLLRAQMNVINLWRPELKVESYSVWKLKQ